MRRRQFLAATAALGTLPGVGHATPRPSATTTAGTLEPLGTTPLDGLKEAVVAPDEETVYAAATDGFAVFDVSDPTAPERLAHRSAILADRPDGPLVGIQDVKLDGDRVAVVGPANGRADALEAAVFYDVSDPAAPERVGVYETDYPIHNCDFADGVAYLTGNRGDRNDLVLVEAGPDPTRLGTWSLADRDDRWTDVPAGVRSLHDVSVQGERAYVAHWDAGTWILDVSDPTTPETVTRVRGRPVAELAELSDNAAIVASTEPPGNDHYVTVNDDATLLAVGGESWDVTPGDAAGGPSGIELWDLSTPTDPQRLSTIDPPPSPDPSYGGVWTTSHNFDFAGERLYTSWYQGGVKVFDVSDPTDPRTLAAWRRDDTTSFWTAQAAGDVFVAASRENPSNDDAPGALFVFPDPPADATVTPDRTPTRTADTDTSTPTSTAPTTTADSTATTGPGFGALGALAALGYGALRWCD